MNTQKTAKCFKLSLIGAVMLVAVFCFCFVGCGEPKATIKFGTISHATVSFGAGEYEVNKEISFTVNAEGEYVVTAVKMNEQVLADTDGTYKFTPTKQITYTLTVETAISDNKIMFTFENASGINKKGVYLAMPGVGITTRIFDNTLNLENGQRFMVVGRNGVTAISKDVWVRKIEFIFASGAENFTYQPGFQDPATYANNVWKDSTTSSDLGAREIEFTATGNVSISKMIVYTQDFQHFKVELNINNLDDGDKAYYMTDNTVEAYNNKTELTSSTKLNANYTYYLLFEPNAAKSKYYVIDRVALETTFLMPYKMFVSDVKEITYFVFTPERVATQELSVEWKGQEALQTIQINEASALQYVKGFMETQPTASLGINSGVCFGETIALSAVPKKGYKDLVLTYNGQAVTSSRGVFTIKIAAQDENTFAFSAQPNTDTRTIIALTGDNAAKGFLAGGMFDERFVFVFEPNDDFPTAEVTSMLFNGGAVEERIVEETTYYWLTTEQTTVLNNAQTAEAKSALFAGVVISTPAYESAIKINLGNFNVEVKIGDTPVTDGDGTAQHSYVVAGNSTLFIKLTPSEVCDMFAVEVNDVRITDSVTKNADGSWTFNLTAKQLEYNVIVQTKTAKVNLTKNITTGFDLEGFPTGKVDCGVALTLNISPSDTLYNKDITVTYNGQPITVNVDNYSFVIVPQKGATEVSVVIVDK